MSELKAGPDLDRRVAEAVRATSIGWAAYRKSGEIAYHAESEHDAREWAGALLSVGPTFKKYTTDPGASAELREIAFKLGLGFAVDLGVGERRGCIMQDPERPHAEAQNRDAGYLFEFAAFGQCHMGGIELEPEAATLEARALAILAAAEAVATDAREEANRQLSTETWGGAEGAAP